jgi:lantibiotic modifying enzyme
VAFWCHGAPGIALSRLRAFEVTGEERHADEARVALRTAREALERETRLPSRDYSLCHGLGGIADVLLLGSQALGADDGAGRAVAAAAGAGLERFASGRAPWPCGIPAGEPPGLFLGLAGIGLFYLRVAGVDAPSPLLLLGPRGPLADDRR